MALRPRARRRAPAAATPGGAAAAPEGRPLRILFVEARAADVESAVRELRRSGLRVEVEVAPTRARFRAALRAPAHDVVLSDYALRGWSGMDALDLLRASGRDTPFLLVAKPLGEEVAVECLKRGVADYVTKDRIARLPLAVQQALDAHALRRREAEAAALLREREARLRQIAENMQEVYHLFAADGSATLYVSPAYETIFGRSVQSLYDAPLSFVDALHPGDRPRLLAELEAIRAGGGGRALEVRVERPDGEERWILARAVGVRDAGRVVRRIAGVALDITDRKRAEETLRQEQFLLRTLMDTIPDPIYFKDAASRFLRANLAAALHSGLSDPAQLLGKTDFDLFAREHAEAALEVEREILRTGEPVVGIEELETWPNRPDAWVSTTKMPLRGPDGAIIGTFGISRDITRRKQAEEALRESEHRLRTVFDRMQLIGLQLDREGRITYCNDFFLRLTGWTRDEALGADYRSAFLPPDSVAHEIFARAMATGEAPVHARNAILTRGGGRREIEWNNTLLHEGDRVTGVVSIGEDVTEREVAEQELRRSEAEFRSLVERAPVGIYRATHSGRFLTVNPALIRMLGYQWAEELLKLDIGRDVYVDAAVRERVIREAPEHVEVRWKRRDGTEITVDLTSHGVPVPQGQEACYEGVVVDVTQQRSLESQFRQAQRLVAVGRLAGGVAHDFNNILTAITGYTDLLLDEFDAHDRRRLDLEEVRAAAQRAAALTRQLLAFSRKQVLQPKALDLNAVVRGIERMLRRLIGEDIALVFTPGAALGTVRADPGQVEQVILNLAVNSRDAMPAGGRLTIETANVELDAAYVREHAGTEPGPYVMLAVSDSGAGMDAQTRAHLFEPFFTTKELGKGTGLGLATVYGIVRQSGGHIGVYSEPGRGATFKIYLPRVDEPPESEAPAADLQGVKGGRETVLLAEDDAPVREIVASALGQKGYRVLRAMDGQSAVEIARAQGAEIRLLITDIVMPGMTGRELAGIVARECPGIRVLFMSGYTDDAVVRHGVLDQGTPYLQKPFTPGALARKVREVLDRT